MANVIYCLAWDSESCILDVLDACAATVPAIQPGVNLYYSVVTRGGFGMGFFWEPKSHIPNPGIFGKKIQNQKFRDFLGFLGLGFFFEWDPKISKNPKLFPVKDLNFSDFFRSRKSLLKKQHKGISTVVIFL